MHPHYPVRHSLHLRAASFRFYGRFSCKDDNSANALCLVSSVSCQRWADSQMNEQWYPSVFLECKFGPLSITFEIALPCKLCCAVLWWNSQLICKLMYKLFTSLWECIHEYWLKDWYNMHGLTVLYHCCCNVFTSFSTSLKGTFT